MTETQSKLRRSRQNRVIAGVCGGLAVYLDIDVTVVRVVFVLLTIIPHGVGLLLYIIMVIVVPEEDAAVPVPSSSDSAPASFVRAAEGRIETSESVGWLSQRRNVIGLAIILLGVSSLVRILIPGLDWADHLFWPLLVIGIGAYFIFTTKRK